jgi:uncharacterized protein YaiE (UPF0345 family)
MKNRHLICLLVLTIIAANASAVSIGAGPSTIDFGKLVKGGYAENQVTVSTSGDEELTCTVEYEGDIKDWLTTDKGNQFTIPANSRTNIRVYIQPPADAANGRYDGALYIKAAPTSTLEGGTGLVVGAGVKIKIIAEVTGAESFGFRVKSLNTADTEAGYPIKITATILNNGNVRVNPNFTASIQDLAGKNLITGEYAEKSILPTREETVEFTLPSKGLEPGKYTANINIYAKDTLVHNQPLTFNLLPKGSWSISAKLEEIKLGSNALATAEIAKITASVKNTGQAKLKTKLKCESYLNDKLSDVLPESDEIDVEPNAIGNPETYYTPQKAGNYVIRCYALYEGKKTDTKTALLKVTAAAADTETSTNYPLYAAGAAILLVLIVAYSKFIKGGRTQPQYQYPQTYEQNPPQDGQQYPDAQQPNEQQPTDNNERQNPQ